MRLKTWFSYILELKVYRRGIMAFKYSTRQDNKQNENSYKELGHHQHHLLS